jgi:hypothetical protein
VQENFLAHCTTYLIFDTYKGNFFNLTFWVTEIELTRKKPLEFQFRDQDFFFLVLACPG